MTPQPEPLPWLPAWTADSRTRRLLLLRCVLRAARPPGPGAVHAHVSLQAAAQLSPPPPLAHPSPSPVAGGRGGGFSLSKQQQPFPFFEDQLRDQRPARGQRSRSRKHELSARLKAINARRALFFCAFVGMPLANNISARKNSRREVGGPAQRQRLCKRQSSNSRGNSLPPRP
jgi:hypothetical protein